MASLLQQLRFALGQPPIDGNGTTKVGTSLDLQLAGLAGGSQTSSGVSEVTALIALGNIAGTAITSITVKECDTVGGTYTAISGASFASTSISATSDNTLLACNIQLGGVRKQFLQVEIVCGAVATLVCAVWLIAGNGQMPTTAAQAGLTEYLKV